MLQSEHTESLMLSFLCPWSVWTKGILWPFPTKQWKCRHDFRIEANFLVMEAVSMTQTAQTMNMDRPCFINTGALLKPHIGEDVYKTADKGLVFGIDFKLHSNSVV